MQLEFVLAPMVSKFYDLQATREIRFNYNIKKSISVGSFMTFHNIGKTKEHLLYMDTVSKETIWYTQPDIDLNASYYPFNLGFYLSGKVGRVSGYVAEYRELFSVRTNYEASLQYHSAFNRPFVKSSISVNPVNYAGIAVGYKHIFNNAIILGIDIEYLFLNKVARKRYIEPDYERALFQSDYNISVEQIYAEGLLLDYLQDSPFTAYKHNVFSSFFIGYCF